MTLRCLGIGWSLAKMTFTYRRAKLYNSIAKGEGIKTVNNHTQFALKQILRSFSNATTTVLKKVAKNEFASFSI